MKIIILAAGKGERLYPLTRNTPKPLLDMRNGKTLLEEQIESIRASGVIDEIILVIGYLAGQIEAKIKYYQNTDIEIKTIYNPFYDISNNLISLWFAKEEMTSPFLVTNGDNLFTPDVFTDFVEKNRDGIFLSISRKERYDDDDMKVIIKNEQAELVSKNIVPDGECVESPGLLLVEGKKHISVFKKEVEKSVRDQNHRNSFWLEIINGLSRNGIPIYTWEFDGCMKWQEIDIHLDIQKVKKLIGIK